MKHLIAESPAIANAFFSLTAAIRENSPLTQRERELILMGILTANNAPRGIVTHVERAIAAGATKAEIVSAITLALPLSGIATVNVALEVAMDTLEKLNTASVAA